MKRKTKGTELTPKQRRFVEEYLIDLNATAAARRAGYSERNADKIGPELLGKTRIAAAIHSAEQARSERTEVTADWVLEKLVKEAERSGRGTSQSARVRALELLGKHLGMFPDRVHHGGDGNAPPIGVSATSEKLSELNLPPEVIRMILHAKRQKAGERLGCAMLPESGNGDGKAKLIEANGG